MNRSEVAALLSVCAIYDSRTIGEADVIGWHEILRDLEFDDAKRAVVEHYATEERRIMPANIRRGAVKYREDRAQRSGSDCPLSDCGCKREPLVVMPPEVKRAIGSAFRRVEVLCSACVDGDIKPCPTCGRRTA